MAVRRGGLYSVSKPETAFVVAFDPGIGGFTRGGVSNAWQSLE